MKKSRSIIRLAICSVLLAALAFFTFVPFEAGVKDYNSVLGAIERDYDVDGGYAYTYTLAKDNEENDQDINDVLKTIASRIDALGYESYSIKAIKNPSDTDYDIRLELNATKNEYGEKDSSVVVNDVEAAMEFGSLEFFGGTEANPDKQLFANIANPVKSAKYNGYNGGAYLYTITFSDEAFEELKLLGSTYYLKITLGGEVLSPFDGEQSVSSANFVNNGITIQTGSEDTAKQQVLRISSGGLANKYEMVKGASNYEYQSIFDGGILNSGLIAIIAVASVIVVACVLFAIFNRAYAVVSFLTLVAFAVLYLLMLLAVPNITISLGGVLGMLLATVLTVDGLVMTIKRIDEEYANGKMVKPAVKAGLKRAVKPIVLSAILSVILSIMFVALTSGVMNGFGKIFAIGAVVSVISTLLVARLFTNLVLGTSGHKASSFNLKRDSSIKEAL